VTEIPVLVPPASGVLTRGYMTPAMFRAFPTWLDTDNLIPGGVDAVQDDALADALLAASDWAVGVCEDMPLHGHLRSNENRPAYLKGSGRATVRPEHIPVRSLISLSWGADPSSMQGVSLPDASMRFEGDGRRMSWRPGGGIGQFTGPALQFGPRASVPAQLFVTWSYVAGFPFALMPSGVASGAESVLVDDPASILPGDNLRVYDPGITEVLTVASTYVPAVPTNPPTPTGIPLAAATANAHAAGTGITGFPRKALQAVIAFTVAVLMRDDVSEEEPASPFGPSARTTGEGRGGQASGLVNDAYGWLAPYKPTLRS
jgi:hypothetical protein